MTGLTYLDGTITVVHVGAVYRAYVTNNERASMTGHTEMEAVGLLITWFEREVMAALRKLEGAA